MKNLLLIIFFSSTIQAYSQTLLDSISNSGLVMDDATGKALAEFAAPKGPAMELASKTAEASRYDVKINSLAWVNNLRASFNMNELNFKASGPNQNVFYPRYNFNFAVPIGMIFTNGMEIKQAKAHYAGDLAQKEILLANQKELIEVAYQEYQLQRMLLALEETVIQDEANVYAQTEEKFSSGGITLDVFSAASKNYNSELSKRIGLMRDRNVAKIKLEKLLGMKLEDALKQLGKPAPGATK